jgi:hypothetical protein
VVDPDAGDPEPESAAGRGGGGADEDGPGAGPGASIGASEDFTASVPDDIRRLDEIDNELAGVDAALRRLSDGTYGTCEVCGAAIDADLLHSIPLATRCSDHAA